MNTILLQPTDILFFRDGRPMGGSLAGHGAAWPLPTVINAAMHAALWRSGLKGHLHDHRHGRATALTDARTFGSLVTAGPFPVGPDDVWFFPRPMDLGGASLQPSLLPASLSGASSLPAPLIYAVANTAAPSKDSAAKAWLSDGAFARYLAGTDAAPAAGEAYDDRDFSDSEATIGIGIDPDTQTQDGSNIYSAHYLRLREGWRLGLCAETREKKGEGRDNLIPQLIDASQHIVVGGQQRLCTAIIANEGALLPLPRGLDRFTVGGDGKVRLKWVLLTPTIFPSIEANGAIHPGGWLPSWIRHSDGAVQLRAEADARGPREPRDVWRARVQNQPVISATLVAALVPKPIPVTGWSLGDETLGGDSKPGAKPTHLAVPAGAVYYFACDSAADARNLASALNWHGNSDGSIIKNRRSTLLGEKGFGLGVCGTWQFLGD